MSVNKKYYYIRLKDNFFDSDALILMESMPDGILYSNILLKMYLKSLKNNGKLMLNDCIPYNSEMIATITRHQVGTIEKALVIFKDLGLIDLLSDNTIYMSDIELLIGNSSTEADRKRIARAKIDGVGQLSDKCPPEIELDIELEKELELEKDIKKDINVIENYFDNQELNILFNDFLKFRKTLKAKNSDRAIKLLINELNKHDDKTKIEMINNSIMSSWKSIYPPKKNKSNHETKMEWLQEL